MPIKYNLTKYDLLAERIHELSQKKDASFSKDEETLWAEATLIASFASSHSWQTYKTVIDGNHNILNSPELKHEYAMAKTIKWKNVRNMDIQEVSCANIRDSLFYSWLSANTDKINKELYKKAWVKLKQEFDEECDGISVQRSV
jgi:hypothetical protein